MSNPCDTCAFRRGSVTHDSEPHNNLKGILCILGAVPFYCHHGFDWEGRDETDPTIKEDIRKGTIQICEGWKREVRELAATGYYDHNREVVRVYAQLGLGALHIFLNAEDGSEAKQKAERQLNQICAALGKHRRRIEEGKL